MTHKECASCLEIKTVDSFYKRQASKDKLSYVCKDCDSKIRKANKEKDPEKEKEYQRQYRITHAEQKRISDANYYANNKEHCNAKGKIYYLEHKEHLNALGRLYNQTHADELRVSRRLYREKDSERIKAKRRQHYYDNPHLYIANSARRRALELQATPKWADLSKIKELYKQREMLSNETGIIHHVDHIVPLNNKRVCGLHCEFNLRIITRDENLSKGNYFQI